MKTISLQQFHADVMKLAKRAGKRVGVARVDLSEYSSGKQYQFECYVEGFSFHNGKTPKEALAKLRMQMFPPISDIEDVTVDYESEATHA